MTAAIMYDKTSADNAEVARTHANNVSARVGALRRQHPDTVDPMLDAAYYASLCAHTYARAAIKEADKIARLYVCAAANDELATEVDPFNDHRAQGYRKAAQRQREQTETHADLANLHYIRACRAADVAEQLITLFLRNHEPDIVNDTVNSLVGIMGASGQAVIVRVEDDGHYSATLTDYTLEGNITAGYSNDLDEAIYFLAGMLDNESEGAQ